MAHRGRADPHFLPGGRDPQLPDPYEDLLLGDPTTFVVAIFEALAAAAAGIDATLDGGGAGRTENLLQQSQQLTIELQTRQTELQATNQELASKAKQLAE